MKVKKIIRKILFWLLMAVTVVALTVGILYTMKGWNLYRAALEDCSIEEKVASIQNEASYTPLSDLPQIYKDAVLAAEDHRFYSHGGVDPIALARAIWNNVRTFSLREGGSTITQQLAKNIYFTQSREITRKIAEMFMAWKLEKELEKDEILELYINCIYYGSGYYCVYDAAQGYFDKEPWELSNYECTLLAGLPNAPSVYDPTVNPELAEQRRQQVLEKMVRHGYLTEAEVKEIQNEKNVV